jgi:hypothetical protein
MEDTTDAVLGGLAGGSLIICCLGIVFYLFRSNRRTLKPSRSDTNLALNDPVFVEQRKAEEGNIEF